jgi:Family of unknown function (DUF5682)
MSAGPHIFGVRHLSPMGAWQLRAFLDRIQPQAVLIEGLSDASGLLADLVSKETCPPVAVLAYTAELPARSLVYPMARYSPEYQAARWAAQHKAVCRFIDLPSDVFLALGELEDQARMATRTKAEEVSGTDDAEAEADGSESEPENGNHGGENGGGEPLSTCSIYEQFAQAAGEPDYESWWERRFEHETGDDSYRLAAFEFGNRLRAAGERAQRDVAENLVREAWMRREICRVIAEGVPADRIVVVCGAYHAPVLGLDVPPMSEEEVATLPRRASKLTLMPYTYFRLSAQSGYGAGNQAPAYFELIWDCLQSTGVEGVSSEFLSQVARSLRKSGTQRSTAEVIEGVRLARTLAGFRGGVVPTLRDLEDAAITCIGHGERAAIADALARAEVGTATGSLKEGVSQTSIQDDFLREMQRLKLMDYRSPVLQTLKLDLRENRFVKKAESAFLDLHRSFFLHRMAALGIPFARLQQTNQDGGTWAEVWDLAWTPEAEITLVESVLLGETVEAAAGYQFFTRLTECQDISAAAGLVRQACECGMAETMERARNAVQRLSADAAALPKIAAAARQLASVVRFGSVRQVDPAPLEPLVAELFVQASLNLTHAANCDDAAAREILTGMDSLHAISQELPELVDDELWLYHLDGLAQADDLNALLSGFACALLLERGRLPDAELSREVSRRLSPGIPAEVGAAWFEGLAQRNHYALLARLPLWQALDDYLSSLDGEEFRRALVFLRRAFGGFSPREKRHIAENLGEVWGLVGETVSEAIGEELSEEEQETLTSLNDFNFDDL